MSKKKIIIEPDPILRKKSAKLEKVDNDKPDKWLKEIVTVY